MDFVVLLVLGSYGFVVLLVLWSLGPMGFVVLLVLWSYGFVVLLVLRMGSCRCVECSVLREGRKERRKKAEGRCLI